MNDPKQNKVFDINYQYDLYKERVGLKGKELHKVQEQEIKRAFMGGVAQTIFLFLEDIGSLDEKDAVQVIEALKNQTLEF